MPEAVGFKSDRPLFGFVSQTTVLVPVRYPLTKAVKKTLSHAIELAGEFDDDAIYILYVNLLQKCEGVTANEL